MVACSEKSTLLRKIIFYIVVSFFSSAAKLNPAYSQLCRFSQHKIFRVKKFLDLLAKLSKSPKADIPDSGCFQPIVLLLQAEADGWL